MRQADVFRQRPEVGIFFVLVHRDGLEKENLAVHVDAKVAQFPVPITEVGLNHIEGSPLRQASEKSATELYLARKTAMDLANPPLNRIDDDSPGHVMKYLSCSSCGFERGPR